jgi:hypothetical protein
MIYREPAGCHGRDEDVLTSPGCNMTSSTAYFRMTLACDSELQRSWNLVLSEPPAHLYVARKAMNAAFGRCR